MISPWLSLGIVPFLATSPVLGLGRQLPEPSREAPWQPALQAAAANVNEHSELGQDATAQVRVDVAAGGSLEGKASTAGPIMRREEMPRQLDQDSQNGRQSTNPNAKTEAVQGEDMLFDHERVVSRGSTPSSRSNPAFQDGAEMLKKGERVGRGNADNGGNFYSSAAVGQTGTGLDGTVYAGARTSSNMATAQQQQHGAPAEGANPLAITVPIVQSRGASAVSGKDSEKLNVSAKEGDGGPTASQVRAQGAVDGNGLLAGDIIYVRLTPEQVGSYDNPPYKVNMVVAVPAGAVQSSEVLGSRSSAGPVVGAGYRGSTAGSTDGSSTGTGYRGSTVGGASVDSSAGGNTQQQGPPGALGDMMDLCGSTCNDVIFVQGHPCEITWAAGCPGNPPTPYAPDSDLYQMCPNTCGPRPEVEEKKTSLTWLWVLLVILGVLGLMAAGGLAAYFFFIKPKKAARAAASSGANESSAALVDDDTADISS